MSRVVGVLVLSLYLAQATADLRQATPKSAGRVNAQAVDARKQAWKILVEGSHGNMDQRANAIQALGLASGDSEAERLAEDALADNEPLVRAAAAKALGALGSSASISNLQNSLNDKDISVALAAGHALIQLKSNSGYDVYYSLVAGTRKGGTSPITEELDQMKTPERAIGFAFDQGMGFVPYGGYGMEAYHAWEKRSTAPTRAAAARELAKDPDPRSGQALAKAVSDKEWSVRAAAVEALATRGDTSFLSDIVPAMSDKKDVVRYTAAAAVLRLSQRARGSGSQGH